ncbi:MAG: hypothetical protein JG774_1447 [Desulfomicrobiaceae bacterium]|jgi:hypothetical protein|nr:hypothetical protein [Desulfomicrobiaceae bacterium]
MRHYTLTHQHSHLGVAFFSPTLATPVDLTTILEMLQATPTDAFLRAEARRLLAQAGEERVRALAGHADPTLAALALETPRPPLAHVRSRAMEVLSGLGALAGPERWRRGG